MRYTITGNDLVTDVPTNCHEISSSSGNIYLGRFNFQSQVLVSGQLIGFNQKFICTTESKAYRRLRYKFLLFAFKKKCFDMVSVATDGIFKIIPTFAYPSRNFIPESAPVLVSYLAMYKDLYLCQTLTRNSSRVKQRDVRLVHQS